MAAPCAAQKRTPEQPRSPSARGPKTTKKKKKVRILREVTPETRRAIKQGIAWLAKEQKDRSGRWPTRPKSYQMSISALAGLALLANGISPDRGKYAKNLRKAILWVLDAQKKSGPFKGLLFQRPKPMGRRERPMHGHGFALLFLGEAYGQTHDKKLRKRIHSALQDAVKCTENSISPQGGWYYWPGRAPFTNTRDEGSVTITQIQGMRAARNAGVHVDARTIKRAVNYIKRSQMDDGGIRYTLRWGRTSAALTAAGIAVMQGAGEYRSEVVKKAYGYLRQNLRTAQPDKQRWFFYTHLYAAQAMYQRGGPEWASYWPRIRRELLDMRKGYPYWESYYGRSYGTAIALLILQLPMRYLPIFQR